MAKWHEAECVVLSWHPNWTIERKTKI